MNDYFFFSAPQLKRDPLGGTIKPEPLSLDPEREFWIRRLEATGRAQSRYLWLLLVACLFFMALHARTPAQSIRVPIVDLDLDSLTVLASGGPIIGFLVLAVVGAIRAWTHAVDQVRGQGSRISVEQLDTHPNAIDLAVYTTAKSPRSLRTILYFAYPTVLIAALVESALLWYSVAQTPGFPRVPLTIVQALVWIPAAFLVLSMLWSRITTVKHRVRAA